MNEIQIFNYNGSNVRTVQKDGEPWFVGKDVAEIIGYSNPRKAIIDHVDTEDKMDGVTICDSIGREQTPVLINESGLYSLILASKMPNAKPFRRWVTSEVLPSIRKHGIYATANTVEQMLSDPDTAIKLLTTLKEERAARQALERKVEVDKPKVLFAEAVSVASTSILVGELAKLLKQNGVEMGQNRLFAWLRDNGYLIKRRGNDYNLPTQRSMELGLFEIKETCVTHAGHTTISRTPKVTGKGQIYFVEKFLRDSSAEVMAEC